MECEGSIGAGSGVGARCVYENCEAQHTCMFGVHLYFDYLNWDGLTGYRSLTEACASVYFQHGIHRSA